MNQRFLCLILLFCIGILGFNDAKSQDTSYVFGNKIQKQKVNYYDFSDPTKVNFEVIAWGGFKNQGKYLVPEGTTMIDMMTYAGLPPNSDLLEDVKLVRAKDITSKYQSSTVIKFNFKKFFDKETTIFTSENPLVKPGDIILVPLELDKSFWDYFKEGLIIIGPIASILSLIVTINSNK